MKAVLAEDEPLLAARLTELLARAWPDLAIAAVAPNGPAALEAIEREKPDVAFLDIRMPGLTGLEVAEEVADRLGDEAPAVVFVTAYDEFALRAFELAAVDYLLKPVTEERLSVCIDRIKKGKRDLVSQVRKVLQAGKAAPATPLRILRAGAGDTVRMIPIEDVCYFRASDKYTAVVTREGESLIRVPLRELLPQLAPDQFVQVHRGTIVNLREVAAAVRDDAGRISLKLRNREEALPVSRIYADQFRQM